jgi:dynein heavy chain
VTDDFDKRLLLTFTSLWFSDRILAAGFEFYQNYTLPSGVNAKIFGVCLDHVANLPATDSPLILGLDSNAEITYQMNR